MGRSPAAHALERSLRVLIRSLSLFADEIVRLWLTDKRESLLAFMNVKEQ